MGLTNYVAPIGEQTLMSTDIDTIANTFSNIGAVMIDNSTNRYLYAEFELVLASVDLSAQTNPAVELYLVPSYDGTNYADAGTDNTAVYPPAQYLVAVMGVNATLAAHRAVSPHILIDPILYKPVIVNKTGAAFVASNTLKVKYYTPTTA
jgi:hypothetical protein